MTLQKLIKEINLNPQASKLALDLITRANLDGLTDKLYEQIRHSERDFFGSVRRESARAGVDERLMYLCVYLLLAVKAHEKYADSDICDRVYFDTMSDIAVWAENCRQWDGVWGISESGWLTRHVRLGIFKLGRLQFEPVVFEDNDVSFDGRAIKKGDPVINVHIQQNTPLDHDGCRASYKAAREFFGEGSVFICESWLLEPELKTLLPETSNIIRFQNDFYVHKINKKSKQFIERVFGFNPGSFDEYPQQSSLQKKALILLKSGKKLGEGHGVLRDSKTQQ